MTTQPAAPHTWLRPALLTPSMVSLREHGVDQVKHKVVDALPHTAKFDVRSVILSSIAEEAPDLVAVGARGTGGFRGLLVGSVTAAVVHHAPGSVLVARTG